MCKGCKRPCALDQFYIKKKSEVKENNIYESRCKACKKKARNQKKSDEKPVQVSETKAEIKDVSFQELKDFFKFLIKIKIKYKK